MAEKKKAKITEDVVETEVNIPEEATEISSEQTSVNKSAVRKNKVKRTTAVKPENETKKTDEKTSKKNSAKEKASRTRKKEEPSLDMVTTALWNKLKEADTSDIQETIAIQIIIYDLGTFFIAVKEGGEKHIIQAVYDDRDGTMETSYEEILKMAKGGYDYLKAVNDGVVNYQGDLKKAIILTKLFN